MKYSLKEDITIKRKKNFKPKLCEKEGTVGNTSFMDQLKVKKGCKIILIHNIDIGDGLTNGQLGILLDVVRAEDGSVAKMIVEFKNKAVGQENRAKNAKYLSKYPNGNIIEKISFNYPMSKKAGSSQATVIQFPLKLAHAITAHKIQGQTIPKPLKVALDIESIFNERKLVLGLALVMSC